MSNLSQPNSSLKPALGTSFIRLCCSVSSFFLGRKRLSFTSLMLVFNPWILGLTVWGPPQVSNLKSSRQTHSSAEPGLPETRRYPRCTLPRVGSGPAPIRLTNPRLCSERVTMAALQHRPRTPAAKATPRHGLCVLPVLWWKSDCVSSSWKRWGSVGKPTLGRAGSQKRGWGAGSRGCCSRVLGRRAERGRAHGEQQRFPKRRVRTAGGSCGHRPAARLTSFPRPRPGRAARGFHGDGKQASTVSVTTAKSPAFYPPLGAQRRPRCRV